MPTYEFACAKCDSVVDRSLTFKEFDDQVPQKCTDCGSRLRMRYAPTSNIIASPKAFQHTFTELYGESEPSYLKTHDVERINPSTFKTRKQRNEEKFARAHKEAASIESALRANKSLTAPVASKKKKRSAA